MEELVAPNDVPSELIGMLLQALRSGSAPPGGTIRLRLVDRTPFGNREGTISVDVDEARAYLRKKGLM